VTLLGLQFVKQVAADLALDGHRVQGKVFIAAASAYGESCELLRRGFFPTRRHELCRVDRQWKSDRRNTRAMARCEMPLTLVRRCRLVDMRGIGNFNDQTVGGCEDAADSDPVERAPQRFPQFVQKETTVARLSHSS